MPSLTLDDRNSLRGHPAVCAWLQLHSGPCDPRKVTVLKQTAKSVVYRIDGIGPGGSAVVAKHCLLQTGRHESFIYNHILSRLPLDSLRCYGLLEEDKSGSAWLFLEDGEGTPFTDEDESFRPVAARWLAALHTSASSLTSAARLPDRGPAQFLKLLQSARARIRETLEGRELRDEARTTLGNLLSSFEVLEQDWPSITKQCESLPWTLVHCDFHPKNVLRRCNSSGIALVPLDWEHAGWGPPAADLGGCIDHASYWSVAQQVWPKAEIRCLEEQTNCGTVFNWLSAVSWETERLTAGSEEKALRRLCFYARNVVIGASMVNGSVRA